MKLKNNLSIDAIMQSYIDTNFYSKHQLGVIRYGLKLGLDVTKYDDPTLPYIEMRKKRRRMYGQKRRHDIENRAKSNNIDLKASKAKYKELNFDKDKIRLLLEIESYGFDMRLYEQVKYDFWTIEWLFRLQQNHVDVSQYLDVASLNEASSSDLYDVVRELDLIKCMTDEEEYEWSHY